MPKIGHSQYIALGKLERLNSPLSKTNYLTNLYKILYTAFSMMENNEYDMKKLANKFPGKQYLRRTDLTKQLKVYTQIEPDIWFRIQTIMIKLTGKIWPMDMWLDFIMGWFIYAYHEGYKRRVNLPLIMRQSKPKRFRLLNKFNKTFKPYYKNIMSSWE